MNKGIPLANAKVVNNLVVADTKEEYRNKVIQWYTEQPSFQEGYGYAPGTLLLHE